MKDAEIVVSTPVVLFQETVSALSSVQCLSKSPNHHNRLYCRADPLDEELVVALEKGEISSQDDAKARARKLVDNYKWDISEAKKIWAFGPIGKERNMVIDVTKGVQYLNEIKDSVVTAFLNTTHVGVLAHETLRGVRFSVLDAHLHPDAIHRGGGQIIPAAQNVFAAAQLTAKPRLLEPIFLLSIQCNQQCLGGVYNALNQKRGIVIEALPRFGTSLYNLKGYLPVTESFGFTEFLRGATSGQAFPQLVFDHWEIINDDPLEEGTRSNGIVLSTRKRKGIEANIPPLDRFLDKL